MLSISVCIVFKIFMSVWFYLYIVYCPLPKKRRWSLCADIAICGKSFIFSVLQKFGILFHLQGVELLQQISFTIFLIRKGNIIQVFPLSLKCHRIKCVETIYFFLISPPFYVSNSPSFLFISFLSHQQFQNKKICPVCQRYVKLCHIHIRPAFSHW